MNKRPHEITLSEEFEEIRRRPVTEEEANRRIAAAEERARAEVARDYALLNEIGEKLGVTPEERLKYGHRSPAECEGYAR